MATMTEQIYETDKVMANTLRLINEDVRISPDNKAAIVEFLDGKEAEGLSPNRLIILANSLRRLARLTTASFKSLTEADARSLIKRLEKEDYKAWTKVTTKKVFKQICRYYKLPVDVYGEWLKVSKPPNELRKEDLLTSEEVNKLCAAAPSLMWRCLLAVLAETGARPSEILSLTVSRVVQNGTHFKLFCLGKMAKKQGERPVFVIKNRGLLAEWISQHPGKDNANAPVFFIKDFKPVSIVLLDRTIKRAAQKAMIKKRVFAYLLRHTVGTALYNNPAITAPVAQKAMGHSSLEMSKVYCHLSDDDVLQALGGVGLKAAPVEVEKCLKCGVSNAFGSMTCAACKMPLSAAGFVQVEQEHAAELEEARQLKALLADPQILSILQALKSPEVIDVLKRAVKK